MCNLTATKKSAAEVASLFDIAPSNVTPFNVGEETYPGYPGIVIRDDGNARHLQTMTWGFPLRLKTMKPTSKPKAVNNARDDKLLTPMWKASFQNRRCLIPLTAWAEAEGEPRKMTRTWYSVHDSDLFAVGGIWRWSGEWGDCYSMVMTEACQQMYAVHDRMPILLRPDQWDLWTRGTPEDAMGLVRTCDDTLAVDRTTVPWVKPRAISSTGPLI